MKIIVGLLVAFGIGFACRFYGLPSPAPSMFFGALLVMTMTLGYISAGRLFPTAAGVHDGAEFGP